MDRDYSEESDGEAPLEISLKQKKNNNKKEAIIQGRPAPKIKKQPKEASKKNQLKKKILTDLKEKF